MSHESWRLTDDDMQAIDGLRKELLSYASERTGSMADAEDLVSETIVAAGRTFEHRTTIQHYLYSILKRQVASVRRREERAPPWTGAQPDEISDDDLLAGAPGPDTQLAWLCNAQKLKSSFERIPVAYREVVRLAVYGYDNFEIAAKLGIEYNTVRSRLSRGNASLTAILRRDECTVGRDARTSTAH